MIKMICVLHALEIAELPVRRGIPGSCILPPKTLTEAVALLKRDSWRKIYAFLIIINLSTYYHSLWIDHSTYCIEVYNLTFNYVYWTVSLFIKDNVERTTYTRADKGDRARGEIPFPFAPFYLEPCRFVLYHIHMLYTCM